MKMKDDYKILEIRDAITAINQKVNLIGVIVEFGFPKKTKGTDYSSTLKMIDKSDSIVGISVNFFAETVGGLPHIGSAGDIIQLSQVKMTTFNGEVYAVFYKRNSSFALYEGKDGGDFHPYQFSPRFHQREQDRTFITAMRKWLVDFKPNEGSNGFSLLREIKEGKHTSLACKILHSCDVANELYIFLWDGTDSPPTEIQKKLEDETADQLPLHLEPFPLSRDVLCSFPPVGSILRVILEKEDAKRIIHLLNNGEWVKLLNISCEVSSGLWCGVMTPFTRLRYIPKEDSLILERQRMYDTRVSSNWGHLPYWSFPFSQITEVAYDHVPFVSLLEVLTHSEVTAKFKCVVRVLATVPWRAEDFRSPTGTYRIQLTLEDSTARIHAFVYSEDGEKLFGGYPPMDVLTKKRNKLLGLAETENGKDCRTAPRNPPWVQCCLKSYYIDKNDIWGSRHYRMFGTSLVG